MFDEINYNNGAADNSLTNIVDNTITSMQIAEMTKKYHHHIIRDIDDEIEKLSKAGISMDTKFGLREREGITGKIRYYVLYRDGVLQLAARYDAVTRAKLIEMANKQNNLQLTHKQQCILAIYEGGAEAVSNAKQLVQLETKEIAEERDKAVMERDTAVEQVEVLTDNEKRQGEYVAKEVAVRLGIYSTTGNPHAQVISAITSAIGIRGVHYRVVKFLTANGQVVDLKYYNELFVQDAAQYYKNIHSRVGVVNIEGRNFKIKSL